MTIRTRIAGFLICVGTGGCVAAPAPQAAAPLEIVAPLAATDLPRIEVYRTTASRNPWRWRWRDAAGIEKARGNEYGSEASAAQAAELARIGLSETRTLVAPSAVSGRQVLVRMLDLRGTFDNEAEGALYVLGFGEARIQLSDGTEYEGEPLMRVIGQSVAPGALVPAGTMVVLTVE